MLILDWMIRDVISVTPETSLLHCRRLFRDHTITTMPVLDGEGHVVGIVTNKNDPADAHAGGEDLGEGPRINGVARLVEGEDRRQVFAVEAHVPVGIVLEDGEAVALRDRGQLLAPLHDRDRKSVV